MIVSPTGTPCGFRGEYRGYGLGCWVMKLVCIIRDTFYIMWGGRHEVQWIIYGYAGDSGAFGITAGISLCPELNRRGKFLQL